MNYRDTIPSDLLKKFDDLGIPGVQAKLDAGMYSGRKKKHATVYVTHGKEERESRVADREETRAEEALSISRSANSIAREALRIARSDRTIAIIAIIIAIASAVFTAISK